MGKKNTPVPGSYIEFQDTNQGIDISQHWKDAVVLTISEKGKAIVLLEDGSKRELTLTTKTLNISVWQFVEGAVPGWFYKNIANSGCVSKPKAIPQRVRRAPSPPPYSEEEKRFPIDHASRQMPASRRAAVHERDQRVCQSCGSKNDPVEIDHKITRCEWRRRGWEESMDLDTFNAGLHDLNNLQTLCRNCHGRKTEIDIQRLSSLGFLKRS